MHFVLGTAEIVGYVASGLVFLTFCMKTMMPLRLVAIASNAAFIAYGAANDLAPILVLHALLLPLNVFRTWQIWQLIRQSNQTDNADLIIKKLVPLMTEERFREGNMVFRRGDISAKLYYIAAGKIEIEEYGAVLEPGSLLGEISLFSEDRARTASARCVTDCRLRSLSEEQVKLLYFQNPQFGYFVIRLVAQRLIANLRRLEASQRPARKGRA